MFISITRKFYAIGTLLVISLGIVYSFWAYFLNQQSQSVVKARDVAIIGRDFIKLNELFHESRYWEKVIFAQNDPGAEMRYGNIIKQTRVLSSSLNEKELNQITRSYLKQIIQLIDQYENEFNRLIQLKTKQSLISTRMETNYRSMASIVLFSNNTALLKQMFNLTHFLASYQQTRNLSKYQALKLVIDSFEKKIQVLVPVDVRMQGYLDSFIELLSEDYAIELDIIATDKDVDNITNQIQKTFTDISSGLETYLEVKLKITTAIRNKLQTIFLVSEISWLIIILFILYLFLRNFLSPIKSIAIVMERVQRGDINARFINSAKHKDDIVQFGLSLNYMLDTLADNNHRLLDYQKELENKIAEISNQKKESQELTDRLHQSQKMESIGTMAGGIAHDFNNILSSILGFTEISLDYVEKGTLLEDNLQEVYTAGIRAKNLVKQILTFARQSGEEIQPIRIDVIAKEVLKFIRSSIPSTIDLRQNIESNSVIMGNSTQVHQIFMNLCTNAAHAMEDKGGILDISMKDIVVDKKLQEDLGMEPGNYIEIIVSDTGSGMSPETVDMIFEPYFTTKGPGEGTGMGLAMVHGIVESYGGTIIVNTALGKGSVFTIYLPSTQKPESIDLYEPEEIPSGKERILFVDDEAEIAKMGSRILHQLGYHVTSRTSSIEAVELFRSKPDDFDLVITDMTMPNITGDEMAIEILKIRPDIPIILCTGFSKKIYSKTTSEIGIKALVYKPVVKADLAKTVHKVLDEAAKSKSCT